MATNTSASTENYGLSQYAATDPVKFLTNYNSDMSAIDTAIKAAKDDADGKVPLARTIAGMALSGDITLEQMIAAGLASGTNGDANNALKLAGVDASAIIDENGNAKNALKLGGVDAANFPQILSGAWTPTLYGATTAGTVTATATTGTYYKIGRKVFISAWIVWSAISGGSGEIRVGALPFTNWDVQSAILSFSTASVIDIQSFGFAVAEIRPSSSSCNIWTAIGAPDFSKLVSTGGWICISGSYLAAS